MAVCELHIIRYYYYYQYLFLAHHFQKSTQVQFYV